ncbi:MAG: hypothetical protein AAF224_08670 [Pseudomonadota bacterium]
MHLSRYACAIVATLSCLIGVTNAHAADQAADSAERRVAPRSVGFKQASIYHRYGNQAFVRGGYIIGSTVSEGGYDAPYGSIGYDWKLARSGNSMFRIESELLVGRFSDTLELGPALTNPLIETTVSQWFLAGLVGVRWDGFIASPVSPYASMGVGPGLLTARATVTDLTTDVSASSSGSEFSMVYSGRAGLQARLRDNFGVELGYRFLDYTDAGEPGRHSVELGLNLAM